MAPVGTVDEVVARLEQLESELPVSDGVHWFNRLYLEVTLAVRDYLKQHTLKAPPFLERLDITSGTHISRPPTALPLTRRGWLRRGRRCLTRATISESRRSSSRWRE